MKRTFSLPHLFLYFAVTVFLAGTLGCAWMQDKSMTRATPQGLYQQGSELYQKKKYKKAITVFQRLKDEYPLEDVAVLAEIGIADSYYSNKEYPDAYIAYDDFVNRHPTDENIPYILYQMGMCRYNMVDTVDRDQSETWKAKVEFERLIARYPQSQFAVMGEKMLLDVKRMLAENEFYVGQFYFKQRKYNAALKRFEQIAKEFPNVGLDYKVKYFIAETRRLIAEEESADKKRTKKLEQAPNI
ncbi:MAG: outer membrane protein assembly factor BamD [Syntrophobacterales bacterium]|jgi:outer membrane protein assembly factor BamD|nr:outer membrane protein assembly factor BamD [Syntrophobacterales bacterium]